MSYSGSSGYVQDGTTAAIIVSSPFTTLNEPVIAGDTAQVALEKLQGQIDASVSSVSVVNANGFSGSVANPTTTPAITLSTPVSGILKGSFGSLVAATASDFPILNQDTTGNAATATTASNISGTLSISQGGTGANTANAALNALLPLQTNNTNKVLQTDGTNTSWQAIGSGGAVTSVNGQVGTVSLGIANMNDVTISSPQNAQTLTYNSSSAQWVNVNFSGGFTVSNNGVATLTNSAVTGQALTGLNPTLGVISATDSILTAINKIVFNIVAPLANAIHKTSSYQMTVIDTKIIMDADNQIVTLPNATQVVIGQTYTLKLGLSAQTGSLAPSLGQTIDGGAGSISIHGEYNSLSVFSDGFNWFVC